MPNLAPSAVPWQGLAFFPALLIFIGVLLFSTATLAFYVKQRVSFQRLQTVFASYPGDRRQCGGGGAGGGDAVLHLHRSAALPGHAGG